MIVAIGRANHLLHHVLQNAEYDRPHLCKRLGHIGRMVVIKTLIDPTVEKSLKRFLRNVVAEP